MNEKHVSITQKANMLVKLLISLFALFVMVMFLWLVDLLNTRQSSREVNCAAYLEIPVSPDISSELCQSNLLEGLAETCSSSETVLQNSDIEKIVKSNVIVNESNYSSVDMMFGKYELYCSAKNIPDHPQFRCDYDISGVGPRAYIYYDRVTEIVSDVIFTSCAGGS